MDRRVFGLTENSRPLTAVCSLWRPPQAQVDWHLARFCGNETTGCLFLLGKILFLTSWNETDMNLQVKNECNFTSGTTRGLYSRDLQF